MSEPIDLNERLAGGMYAQKQIFSKDKMVAWSHSSRFQKGRSLIAPFAGKKLLDFGCGDGTFLVQVSDLMPDAVGCDISPGHVSDNIARLSGVAEVSFVLTPELDDPRYDRSFDVVTCMEVLEHCTIETIEAAVEIFHRVLKPDGKLIVSVPIEMGPSLLGKELVRTIAGKRNIGEYAHKESYSAGELAKMVLAGPTTTVSRDPYNYKAEDGSTVYYHLHKGFNWKSLRPRIEKRFVVDRPSFSPMGWSRGLLSSQVWFVGQPRA